MRRSIVTLLSLLFCLNFACLGWTQCCQEWNPQPSALPGPDPVMLWEYLTQANSYRNWSLWSGQKEMEPGQAEHGKFYRVYVNRKARQSYSAPASYDSIIVNENYNEAKKLVAITVMYKIKGYNPAGGDWYWAHFTPAGGAKKFGESESCISCHKQKAHNDFIMSHELKEPLEGREEARPFIFETYYTTSNKEVK